MKPFACTELLDDGTPCGQAFAIKGDLDKHINAVHRQLKPFMCNEIWEDGTPCGQAFAKKQDLEQHINAVHRKLKPYVCDEPLKNGQPCGQAFSDQSSLKKHIDAVHRKLKPFSCNELLENGTPCGQVFATKGNLDQHINAVHRQLKPYVCPELLADGTPCGQAFATNFQLKTHINAIHRRFYCTKCGKPFKQENDRDRHEAGCSGIKYETLKTLYHMKKGASVEDVIAAIIEQHCEQINIPTSRQKEFIHPTLGSGKVDLYCEGLEGKRVAIDVTTAKTKNNIVIKWIKRRYQDYPGVDELWVTVCSNAWDSKRCAELTEEAHRKSQYRNVYVYNWKDLLDIKMMTIPPKVWKLLEIYEMCTLENKEECKKYWEEAKERFHIF